MTSNARSGYFRFRSSAGLLAAAFFLHILIGHCVPAMAATPLEEKVTQAVRTLYIHGLTKGIAQREVGPEGVPVLIQLLADPDFNSRDNVVVFLGHLGGSGATEALLAFLKNPPAPVTIPEEDRALLVAPQALGQIAARGERRALEALMEMTAPGSQGGILASAAARGPNPDSLRDDLIEMALRGLAYSKSAKAGRRIEEIAEGSVTPAPGGRKLDRAVRSARELFGRPIARPRIDPPPGPLDMPPDAPGTTISGAFRRRSPIPNLPSRITPLITPIMSITTIP